MPLPLATLNFRLAALSIFSSKALCSVVGEPKRASRDFRQRA
jgi:hypothetical protein